MIWVPPSITSYTALLISQLYPTNSLQSVVEKELEKVGKLPLLGYNGWNHLGCSATESTILSTANLLNSTGLLKVGYNQINLDDCWSLKERDNNQHLQIDYNKFPNGLKYLSDKLKGMGISMGIYGSNGLLTCHYPGSFGHELKDARDFVSYGVNLLKYDNCHMAPDRLSLQNEPGKYQAMKEALETVARETKTKKLMFNICEWGVVNPWLWGRELGGSSWRATTDIAANWESIMAITNIAAFISGNTDFYGRNDFDILEVGNGDLTFEENKSHFTIWALTKSHLLLGTNLANLSPELLSVLKHERILAINQDEKYGQGISPFRWTIEPNPPYKWGVPPPIFLSDNSHPAPLWSGRTSFGIVILILNTYSTPQNIKFDLVESPWLRAGIQHKSLNLYTEEEETIIRTYNTKVESHGVVVLLLNEDGIEPEGSGRDCQALNGFNCGFDDD